MENIVYILGAGFSAPLGLPVMKNFLEKSKDMYALEGSNYHYFESIFKRIKELHYLKSFIESDLFNIEEILSVLEMGFYVGENNKDLENYKQFLKNVITYYTPKCIYKEDIFISNYSGWYKELFKEYYLYGYFICSLFNIIMKRTNIKNVVNNTNFNFEISQIDNNEISYSIITLNYDMVIENIISLLDSLNKPINDVENVISFENKLAKLHGSIDTDIVLPTWNKSSLSKENKSNCNIQSTWKKAYEMIKNANQIRIIGYSLPSSDNYMKYLLSIGIKDSRNLKNIDVLTIDTKNNETEKRYRDILIYPKLRFKNCKVEDYFKFIFNKLEIKDIRDAKLLNLENIIENKNNGHNIFMDQ